MKDSIAKIKRQMAAYGAEVNGRRCYTNGSPVPYDCDGYRQESYPRPDRFLSKGYHPLEDSNGRQWRRNSTCVAEVYDDEGLQILAGYGQGWREAWENIRKTTKIALHFEITEIEAERKKRG